MFSASHFVNQPERHATTLSASTAPSTSNPQSPSSLLSPLTLFLLSSFSRMDQTQDCARASLALGWLVTGLWPEDLPSLVNPTTHQSAFPAPVLLYHLSELTGLLCGVAARQSRRGFQPRVGGWAQEAGWRGAKGAHDSRDRPPPRCARPRDVENLACLACRPPTSVRLFARDGMTRRSLPDSL